jgi:hypothetical protein
MSVDLRLETVSRAENIGVGALDVRVMAEPGSAATSINRTHATEGCQSRLAPRNRGGLRGRERSQ